MVDAYTSTTTSAALVETAIDRYIRADLRHTPLLRSLADTRPVQVNMPGDSVKLYTYPDLDVATTPLNETTDPDAVALGDPTATTITLNEYGVPTISTIRLKQTSFSDVDANQMDQIAYNMRNTLDVLVRDVLSAGTNVLYSGNATSTISVDNADVIASNDIRKAVTTLRRNAAQGRHGDLYTALVHPDVSFDLRKETDAAGWRLSHQYAAPGLIWPGEIGVYEGARFIESARMKVAADGTNATPDANVYRSLVLGKEALAEAVAIEPHAVVGNVTDKLKRFYPLGWYGFLGWSIFRQDALVRIESGSSFNA